MPESSPPWAALAAAPAFRQLQARKSRFLWSLLGFSVVFYFLLPTGAAWFGEWFVIKVVGPVNAGLLFALSQFLVAWGVAWWYARRASEFDRIAGELASTLEVDRQHPEQEQSS
ncbi:MAG: DUF485 domain-containing protein [Gammaproteobacteria bacterium]|nr:DUF485 domain-containing protein [Gammaproteobacteria bacterium]